MRTIASLAMLFPVLVISQNLVPNSGFENRTPAPCQFTGNQGAFNISIADWTSPSPTTPDIYSMDIDSVNCAVYATKPIYTGGQLPHSGNAMVGFHTYTSFPSPSFEWREYLHNRLSSKMIVGQEYEVSFWVSLAENSKYATANFGVLFSGTAISHTIRDHISVTPTIEFPDTVTNDTGWVKLCAVVTATQPWEYMVIGNFHGDDDTDTLRWPKGGSGYGGYYYIDDVNVSTIEVDIDVSVNQSCGGSTTSFQGPGGTINSWEWDFDNDGSVDDVSQNPTHTFPGPGDYPVKLTVSDGGCLTKDTTFTITVTPSGSSIDLDLGPADTAFCSGSSITLDATNSGATYEWNDGSTDATLDVFASGKYWVKVSANGCTESDTIDIEFSNFDFEVIVEGNNQCDRFGGISASAYLTGLQGSVYTFEWSVPGSDNNDSITGLKVGEYTVAVTDGTGCSRTKSFEVSHFIELEIVKTDPSCANCTDGTAMVNVSGSGSPPYTFRWSDPNDQTTQTATGLGNGIYTVTVTDSAGCFIQQEVTVGTVGIDETDISDLISVFPNPSSGVININNPDGREEEGKIMIYDSKGILIQAYDFQLPVSNLKLEPGNGLYFLQILIDGRVIVKQIQVLK